MMATMSFPLGRASELAGAHSIAKLDCTGKMRKFLKREKLFVMLKFTLVFSSFFEIMAAKFVEMPDFEKRFKQKINQLIQKNVQMNLRRM